MNTDINTVFKADVVASQRKYWKGVAKSRPWVKVESRLTADEFVSAMRDGKTPDHILYLYCHAASQASAVKANESSLEFSDGRDLTLADLKRRTTIVFAWPVTRSSSSTRVSLRRCSLRFTADSYPTSSKRDAAA